MARNSNLVQLRNANIKKRYNDIASKNPKWRNDAVLEEVAKEFFLAVRTVTAIINNEGIYGRTG